MFFCQKWYCLKKKIVNTDCSKKRKFDIKEKLDKRRMDEATLSNKKNDSKDYKKTKQWTLEQYSTNSRVESQIIKFDICSRTQVCQMSLFQIL